jgi:thiol-disulfide isomerase/thioredoxin
MKNLKFILVMPGFLVIQSVSAQTGPHLNLSNQYPAAGEKITLNYDPAGTVADGKKDITAVVYYLDDKDNPAMDIDLKADGRLLSGEISVPATAKAFVIKISSGDLVDNNNDKGYVYLIYKDKKPVQGAYVANANILAGLGNYLAKIKADNNEAATFYKKEFALYPQSEKDYQTGYYFLVARNPGYREIVTQKISVLEKSSDEKDLILASNLLRVSKGIKDADSLNAVIKGKFPDGLTVKSDLQKIFFKEKDLHKKDSLYNVYITKYPENTTDNIQDNLKLLLAIGYLQNFDFINYKKYESQLKDKSALAGYLNNVSWNWALEGTHLDDAEKVAKESVDIIATKLDNPVVSSYTSANQAKKNALGSYNASADTYAYILWKENKSAEALPYMKAVYDRTSDEENSSEHYALILAGVGQYDKALDVISKSMMAGQSSAVLKEELKKDYIKVKGSENGYDPYLASLERASKEKIMANLAKTMINQPAPVFTLMDLDGKAVSLGDLKGKVVIVDFWATWCGPCKASFPGMQMAVTKFKDNPNVKFIFVDCWENGDNYLPGVKNFIADNKYTFHVLVDEKGADDRQSKVVSTFGVDGIPTKFIIDKNGNIRFKYVGYSGTPEKVLDEVSNMVDLASNSGDGTKSSK